MTTNKKQKTQISMRVMADLERDASGNVVALNRDWGLNTSRNEVLEAVISDFYSKGDTIEKLHDLILELRTKRYADVPKRGRKRKEDADVEVAASTSEKHPRKPPLNEEFTNEKY